MNAVFDKIIVATDFHFGENQNSPEHNQDCIEYLYWLVEQAKSQDIKTLYFLGDWHHSRRAINIETLQYSVKGLNIINDYFDKILFIEGNHDLFYRESRDISSVSIAKSFSNIEVITEPLVIESTSGNVGFYPWLVGEEWKELKNTKLKYVFGHFELPTFLLNAMIEMKDKGELNPSDLKECSYVFSGHFHKRQQKKNIIYIGNAFGHNFNDVNDDDRGCMVLKWNETPVFINWPGAPKFRRFDIESLKSDETQLQSLNKIKAEVTYPHTMSYAEASEIKDRLMGKYDFRFFKLIKDNKKENSEGEVIDAEKVDNVDNIVVEQIRTIESDVYDPELMISIYLDLDSEEKE